MTTQQPVLWQRQDRTAASPTLQLADEPEIGKLQYGLRMMPDGPYQGMSGLFMSPPESDTWAEDSANYFHYDELSKALDALQYFRSMLE